MTDYEYIDYTTVDDGVIAIITLNRPEQRNAQHRGLLVELDDAFMRAERDDNVRVVLLRGNGPSFSSGHDMGSADHLKLRTPGPDQHPSYGINGGTKGLVEANARQEWHYFFSNTKRWRDLRKITIAAVHGPVYSAGLMIAWACDLIVADETAVFADVVASRLGMPGVEYFAHPWELGPRLAKELLLTGDSLDADEAHRIGMVSKVYKKGELNERSLAFARRVAECPSMTALMIKESVNQAQDAQGFQTALHSALTIHALNHAYWGVETRGAALALFPDPNAPRSSVRPRDKHT